MKFDITIDLDEIESRYKRQDIELIGKRAKTKAKRRDSYAMANALWNREDIEMILRVEDEDFFGWVLLRRGDI